MTRSKLPLAIAGLMLLPAASFAAKDVSYTYVEVDYLVQNIDFYEDDQFDDIIDEVDNGDGFKVEASYAFTDTFFVFGNYSNTESDFTFEDDTGLVVPQGEDIKTMKLGAGFLIPIHRDLDFVGRAAYMDMDIGELTLGAEENPTGDLDELGDAIADLNDDDTDGFSIDAGVRGQVVEWLEAGGGLRYTDLGEDDDVSLYGSVLFEINQNFGINVALDMGDRLSTYQVGVRFSL